MAPGICSGCGGAQWHESETTLVGVVSDGAPSHKLSFEAGRVNRSAVTTTIADGVASTPRRRSDRDHAEKCGTTSSAVSDDEAREACGFIFHRTHNTVEGAGALALAAALKRRTE